MKKTIDKKTKILIFILIVQTIFLFYWGSQKEGFFMDDIYSYGLSNHQGSPYIPFESGKWYTEETYMDYVIVDENHTFDYANVWQNQKNDTHPPLYYYILHTISSFFPEIFSKWFALCINLVFLVLSNILLYKISKCIFTSSSLQLMPSILWCFSIGSISSYLLLRMYAMLTFFILLQLYLHLNYISGKNISNRTAFTCILSTFMGFSTQYYFVIFAFFLALTECIVRLIRKQYLNMFKYGLSFTLGVCLTVICFTPAITHLFLRGHGEIAVNNIFSINSYFEKIVAYMGLIEKNIFATNLKLIIVWILIVVSAICLLRLIKNKKNPIALENFFPPSEKVIILTISTMGYILLVSITSSNVLSRYIYAILPIAAIIFIATLNTIFDLANKGDILNKILIGSITIIIVTSGLFFQSPDWLYKDGNTVMEIVTKYSNLNCIYLCDTEHEMYNNFFELTEYKSAMFEYVSNVDNLSQDIKPKDGDRDKLILYIQDSEKYDIYLKEAMNKMKYTSAELLYRYQGKKIYLLS